MHLKRALLLVLLYVRGQIDCTNLPKFTGSASRTLRYQYNGSAYSCNWDTMIAPDQSHWGAWTELGTCTNGGSSNNNQTTTTARPTTTTTRFTTTTRAFSTTRSAFTTSNAAFTATTCNCDNVSSNNINHGCRCVCPNNNVISSSLPNLNCRCVCSNNANNIPVCTSDDDWNPTYNQVSTTLPNEIFSTTRKTDSSFTSSGQNSSGSTTRKTDSSMTSSIQNSSGSTNFPLNISVDEYEDPMAGRLSGEGSNWEEQKGRVSGKYTDNDGACIFSKCSNVTTKNSICVHEGRIYQAKWDMIILPSPSDLINWSVLGTCTGDGPRSFSDAEIIAAYSNTNNVAVTILQPWNPSLPTREENQESEIKIGSTAPLYDIILKSGRVNTIENIEKIRKGAASNPDNVKRVERILPEQLFEKFFAVRNVKYSYENLLKGIAAFPSYCSGEYNNSDEICKRLLAATFAHFVQETGANTPSLTLNQVTSNPEHHNPGALSQHSPSAVLDVKYQGLWFLRESGYNENIKSSGYESCDSMPWAGVYPCHSNVTWFGRGSKQLSWNYNYGYFSQVLYGTKHRLLTWEPANVADTWLNLASAIWFAVTPQAPKPPMLWCFDGSWVPNDEDKRVDLLPGFGATIQIINGGIECGRPGDVRVRNRVNAYQLFLKEFGLSPMANEILTCDKTNTWPAGSAAAIQAYWGPGGTADAPCILVNYQTPFNIMTHGDYNRCVNFFTRSITIKNGRIIGRNGFAA